MRACAESRDKRQIWGLAVVSAVLLCLVSSARGATLISSNATWRYLPGTAEASDPRSAWREIDFDVSSWSSGTAPIGYPALGVNTHLSDMQGNYSTFFMRKTFTVGSVASDTRVRIKANYDDGFILWINGERIWDKNEPDGMPTYDSVSSQSGGSLGTYEDQEAGDAEDFLEVGASNVIAVQVFNRSLSSSGDCRMDVEVSTYRQVADTKFSHDRGFYDAAFWCTITTETPGATIRYTLNGSDPSDPGASGLVSGSSPLPVWIDPTSSANRLINGQKAPAVVLRAYAFHADGEYEPTNVDTHTYIFLAQVPNQPNCMNGEDWIPGEVSAGLVSRATDKLNTLMDPDVVTDPRYAGQITNALRALPTLCVNADYDDVFGNNDGIFHNSLHWGIDWERPASLELIYPDGSKGFQVNCGIRTSGAYSRGGGKAKCSISCRFRGIYGPAKLEYKMFPGSKVERFDQIRLRAQSNDGWHFDWSDNRIQYVRDEFGRQTQQLMGWVAPVGTWMHVYVNGMYWGVYNPVEVPDEDFMEAHFGGDSNDYDVMANKKVGGLIPDAPDDPRIIDGTIDSWNAMTNWIKGQNMATLANYEQAKGHIDVEQFVDYTMLQMWSGNNDCDPYTRPPIGNNWRAGRQSRNRGALSPQYQFFVWDIEASTWLRYLTQWDVDYDNTMFLGIAELHDHLKASAEYKTVWGDHVYRHMIHTGGALTPWSVTNRYRAMCAELQTALIAESARWGDAAWDTPKTVDDDWVGFRDAMLSSWLKDRTGYVIQHMKDRGLYPLLDPPAFGKDGGVIGAGFALTLTNPNAGGTLVYRKNGDPRGAGGGTASGAVNYSSPIGLSRTTQVKARVRNSGGTWSAVHAATFNYTAHHPLLRLTEIHYNPLGGGDFEFLEIQNVSGSTTVGLSEMTFEKGLDYTFGPGAELGPGKFAVLVRNEAVFTNRYPSVKGSAGVPIFGVYSGGLDNAGERLTLLDSSGATVFTVRYNDKDPWPEPADGDGFSLVYTGADDDQDHPEKWRVSNLIGGSPGYDEGDPYRVVINEALTHTDLPQLDTIELYNAGDASVDIGGWWLSDSDVDFFKYQLPSHSLGAGGYKTYTETALGFQLSSHGDEIYLTRWDAASNLLYYAEARFGGAENGRAFGRYVKSDGDADFVAQSVTNTLGSANAAPLVGPVVINEFMYHPPDGGDEFVELLNISDTAVSLYDPAHPTNTWRLDGAVEYMFPTGVTLQAGEICLVVATNSRTGFRNKYGVPAEVQIFKQYSGVLNNAGESIKLWRPDTPDVKGIPWILVDRVKYNDNSPWPESADGDGPSLERTAPGLYGNDGINWSASLQSNGTPGTANSGVLVSKTAGWKYHDRGSDLGTTWRAAAYDDSGWDDGNGPLGYPDTDLDIDTVVDFGEDAANKHITSYFRKAFSLEDPADVDTLTLRIRYDDGYVAYLNGQEVVRGTMAPGAVSYSTLANAANGSGGLYAETNLTAQIGALLAGVNVLAVEVHQRSASSSDLFMDLELVHTVTQGAAVSTPTISPAGGDFYGSVSVTVTTVTAGATIFYTTDGSTPSDTNYDGSGVNSAGFGLTDTTTVKAKAYKQDLTASSVASATFTDKTPTVRFVSSSSSGSESQTSPSITVELSNTSTQTVRVDYQTTGGGTASAGDDYTATSGTLTFSPSQTQKSIVLSVTDDADEEDDETVVLQLSNPQNAVLGTSMHTYTIEDNDQLFTAYNDLSWGAGQLAANITRYTTDSGDGTPPDGASGYLVDFATGETTTVTLAVAGGNWNGAGHTTLPGNPDAGTDASAVFSNIVDCTGQISYGANLTLSFSGMDSGCRYELVVFGNRDNLSYTGRTSKLVLTGVESGFANESTAGATISTTTLTDDTTTIRTGYNTTNGLVARWTNIDPGSDGNMLVTVYDDTTLFYANALMLKANSAAGPGSLVKVAKGANWTYHKGTTEASDPADLWRRPSFDDSGWTNGAAPFGYGDGPYGTDLTGMEDLYTSVFLRREFTVEHPARVDAIELWALYDDGFIMWINGTEVARHAMGGAAGSPVAYDATATNAVNNGTEWGKTLTGAGLPVLDQTNVLAVQVFNADISSSDLTLDVELAVTLSSPSGADTDADGLPDDYENARLSGMGQDGAGDKDLDGVDNLSEWVLGTDPDDDGSETLALDTTAASGSFVVSFPTREASGTGYSGLTRHYGLQHRGEALGPWSDVGGYADIVGTNQTVTYTNPAPAAASHYRARVWLE